MMRFKTPLILATVNALALAGCEQTPYSGDPNANTKQGLIGGAVIGGLIGAASGGTNRLGKAAIGAAAGAVLGDVVDGTLDAQARDLRNSMTAAGIKITNTGSELIVQLPEDLLFRTDSIAVGPGLQDDLRALADNLRRYRASSIQIIGHTDNVGTADYNLHLSQQRAESVATLLENDGVDPRRIVAEGRGESQPVATNLTPAGRAQNRRVNIHIIPKN